MVNAFQIFILSFSVASVLYTLQDKKFSLFCIPTVFHFQFCTRF